MADGHNSAPREDWISPFDLAKLREDFQAAIARCDGPTAILGSASLAGQLLSVLEPADRARVHRVYDRTPLEGKVWGVPVLPLPRLSEEEYDVLVVAADQGKEEFIEAATPYVRGSPKVIVAGYAHLDFDNADFHRILNTLSEPSLANGYPNTRPHLFQCLQNAARLGLNGVIAEFGAFRGGTTMFLAQVVKHFHKSWRIYAFDTFQGFPPRRSLWDMYDHEDLYQNDLEEVRQYLAQENVQVVPGDIVETARILEGQPMVLTFIDADNFTPAAAALDVVQDTTVIGGAIVFDHFAGLDRFRYTLGERRAAKRLLDDARYFNLHSTGVFFRQR